MPQPCQGVVFRLRWVPLAENTVFDLKSQINLVKFTHLCNARAKAAT